MEIDNELLDIFVEEVGELKLELTPTLVSLNANPQQPELFLTFSQVIDRIYGTATTMGFIELGEYLGVVRNITRKCGNAKIPRAMPEVLKIARGCMEEFDTLQSSLKSPDQTKVLLGRMRVEMNRATKIENEIFAYSKDAKTLLR
jgi:chemotaxis protein histidine kinase CheA